MSDCARLLPRQVSLVLGKAEEWRGHECVDLVLTNPYGALPTSLRSTPMLIHQWVHRKSEAEAWCGNKLTLVGAWNDEREAFWCANMPAIPVDLSDLRPEPGGWYPPDLVRRLLAVYGQPGMTVWDGFMGRGTVGRVAREMGMAYIGVEELPEHMRLAVEYLAGWAP
jgi:hypothetical protein